MLWIAHEKSFLILPSLAQSDSSVLITGETGTGKDMVAEAIHQSSKRAKGPFVKINCGHPSQSRTESQGQPISKGSFVRAQRDPASSSPFLKYFPGGLPDLAHQVVETLGVHRSSDHPVSAIFQLGDGDDKMGDVAVAHEDVADEDTVFKGLLKPEHVPINLAGEVVRAVVGHVDTAVVENPQVHKSARCPLQLREYR